MRYSFDVTVTSQDALREGMTEQRLQGSRHEHHRVVVEAPDLDTATLIAAQMAACHGVVTSVMARI